MALEPLAMSALLVQRVEDASATGHPTRVAIDGPDCAGKTTLANELADDPPRWAMVDRKVYGGPARGA
jgi:hypothetical protein